MAKKVYADLEFQGGAGIQGLPAANAAGEPVTWEQLLAAIEGLKSKDPVRVATSSNVNLASPGASLDGVTMANGDRFLALAQTTGAQGGIYVFNGAATPATRALDASTFTELVNALIPVAEGTSANVTYRQTVASGTIDSTTPVFAAFGTAVPNASDTVAGKVELATTAETTTGSDATRAVTPAGLAASVWAKRLHAQDFGDGSATQYDITHNFNTLDVLVQVVLKSTGETVELQTTRTGVNAVRINSVGAIASNAMRVLVLA